ncbi:MAG: ribosomal RNA small subunit methyltransferase A [Candidatus Doudnabacteria bacterium]|nr:ribosomal RNA small subunit methyltransferase A [Candidatus Doudnabacteria bacterium]
MRQTHHSNLYTEIQRRLRVYGLSPDKKLGQNFLSDEEVLDTMRDAAHITPGDVVLEVGPGVGTLTERLLKAGAVVVAVEKDERFRPLLNALARQHSGLRVVFGDVLRLHVPEILNSVLTVNTHLKVVANIPYYVTGKLVQQLLRMSTVHFESLTLLVQYEVAQNMLAVAGHMNLLGLSVHLVGAPTLIQVVPATAFIPPPKVASAVVHIALFPKSLVSEDMEVKVFRIAKACFAGKRKQIHNTLAAGLGLLPVEVDELLQSVGIAASVRPQNLTEHDFIRLTEVYYQKYAE